MAPLVRGRKGEYKSLIEETIKEGFTRIRIDNKNYNLNSDKIPKLKKNIKHNIEIIIDRNQSRRHELS